VSIFVNDSLWVAIGNLEEDVATVRVSPLQGDGQTATLMLEAGRLTVLRYWSMIELPEVLTFNEDE